MGETEGKADTGRQIEKKDGQLQGRLREKTQAGWTAGREESDTGQRIA